jgi:asparagine synthase (glutamine-hydrolysing)
MCGINGIFAFHSASGLPDSSELLRTRDAMHARGPDGAGSWWNSEARCGFGHRRLSIIDLSDRASQPMVSEDGQFVLVFNGEIYNYPTLRRQLSAAGVCFRTSSDSEVLLHLYARHGKAMTQHIRGMFAFAIWDSTKGGLFLARDPYGIKPLYYSNDGWTFRFASQVKALLAGGRVSHDPEPAGLVGFHLFGSVPEPFTLYRDIRALPAGHTQWIDAGGPTEPQPFANLAATLATRATSGQTKNEMRDQIRTALSDSVRSHLIADVEVGVLLSAGVDSGAVLGLMRDHDQREIRAITLAFDEFKNTPEDEAPLAARVADRYAAKHVVRRISRGEFLADLPAIVEAMDQPSIDGVNTWFVSKAAREAGLKVVLSGLGGDELLAGYPSFRELPRWRRRFGPFAAIPGLGRLLRVIVSNLFPTIAAAHPKALGVGQYADSWAGVYLLRRGLFLPYELEKILGHEIAFEGLRRLSPLRHIAQSIKPDPGNDVARVCALESANYMRNQLLRDADWAGMAHGLEIRVPLVDFTLLRSLAPIMDGLRPGDGKSALAHAPSLALPQEIVRRAKTGFLVPTEAWMSEAANKTAQPASSRMGHVSRRWSRMVINGPQPALQAHA